MNALVLRMKVWLRKHLHNLRIRILGKNAEEQAWECLDGILPGVPAEQKARAIIAALCQAEADRSRYQAYKAETEALFEGDCPAITKLLLARYGPDDSLWKFLEQKGAVKPGHAHSELGVLEVRNYFKSSDHKDPATIEEVGRARLSSLARLESLAEEHNYQPSFR